jgi:hypothetical protein
MLKRRIFVPLFAAIAINLALTGYLLTQANIAFAQLATLTPPEEEPAEAAPTPAPAEEAPPAEPTPTAAPVQEAAPAEAAPTVAPAEEAAPAESTPSTMPVTGVAADPLTIMLIVSGTVVALGGLSAYSSRRKRVE